MKDNFGCPLKQMFPKSRLETWIKENKYCFLVQFKQLIYRKQLCSLGPDQTVDLHETNIISSVPFQQLTCRDSGPEDMDHSIYNQSALTNTINSLSVRSHTTI